MTMTVIACGPLLAATLPGHPRTCEGCGAQAWLTDTGAETAGPEATVLCLPCAAASTAVFEGLHQGQRELLSRLRPGADLDALDLLARQYFENTRRRAVKRGN